MKFIYCFSQELKNKLLESGFKIIHSDGDTTIFENASSLKFNFDNADKSQFIFSNKMMF